MTKKASRRVTKSGSPATLTKGEDEPDLESMEGEEEEGDEEGDEDEEEDEEEEEKSELTPDDLRKSLQKLERLAATETPASRKESLLSKALSADLAEPERSELFAMLGGGSNPNSLPAQVEKSMDPSENEAIAKGLDVSEFLNEMHSAMSTALGTVADTVEKSQNRQHEFNVVLAKGVLDMGRAIQSQSELLKSITARLGIYEQQPARGPKTKGISAPIEKSFAQQDPDKLSKSQVLDTLEQMAMRSDADGRGGTAMCGEDLLRAVAKYESQNLISKALYGELIEFRRSGANDRAVH